MNKQLWGKYREFLGRQIEKLIGGISSVAQWFGVTAYKFGEANVISNVEYSQMIYSLLLGYYFFSEMPNLLSFAGAAIIVVSVFLPHLLATLSRRYRSALIMKRG